jgi:hypothetical protein
MSLRTVTSGKDLGKRILVSFAVVGAAIAGTFAVASPAQADSANGCAYPRVCFYKTGNDWSTDHPTAAFQDVTSGYQTLGTQSRGSYGVYNTRNNDGALLHFTNGQTRCLTPNRFLWAQDVGTVDKIRIMDSASC